MEDVAVYVCTGFLESGKTTFIKDTLVLTGFYGRWPDAASGMRRRRRRV